MITPRVKFEKQFGDGVDPWYAKAERWAKKQKFPISFLALGLIEYLKKVWVNVKVENTMRSVLMLILKRFMNFGMRKKRHTE